jgi:hypothetical protein
MIRLVFKLCFGDLAQKIGHKLHPKTYLISF